MRSADHPHTSCCQITSDRSIAPNAVENRNIAIEAPVNGRRRNSDRSTSGLRPTALFTANSARASAAPASAAIVLASSQPHDWPLTRPSVSAPTPPVSSTAPIASGAGTGCPGMCGSRRQPTISAARPIGTLTRNTQRQLAATSRPPTTGPSAAASPPTAAQARTAPWRRSGEDVASTRPSEVGVSSAAPAAWITLNATSIVTLVAAPQAAEAATNTATPSRKPRSRG